MKALKSHPHIERPRRINSQITLAKYTAGLVLTLVGLISAALMKGPLQLASAETVAVDWSNAGSLNTARSDHTATLLPDGKVLVAGGSYFSGDRFQSLNGTELYDPATGKWNATGSLNVPRSGHTATLLPDGKVLVLGAGGEFFGSAEVHDPATGKWNVTGRLNVPRGGNTATLLPDGKVLIVGGSADDNDSLNGAELYDPKDERWSVTGSLNTPRCFHTATLLKNGKVLVVGGDEHANLWDYAPRPLATVELYDPDTGVWSFTGHLNTGVEGHTATLLSDGRVLIVGGDPSAGGPIPRAQLYDPDTGEWSITGHLIHYEARIGHTATLLPDGKVLVAGGWGVVSQFGYSYPLSSSELYDPDTGTWSFAGDFNTPRTRHTATLLYDGRQLFVGGLGLPPKDCAVNCYSRELASVELGNNVTPCSVSISRTAETFDSNGGTGTVGVTAASECNWSAASYDSWISITPFSSSGDGTVSYSVAANTSTNTRRGVLRIAVRNLIVTQAGLPVRITSASVMGKRLFVIGENFDFGALILLNGEEQITKNDPANPRISLIGKKAGRKIGRGQMVTLQVVNPNGSSSDEFSFTRQ